MHKERLAYLMSSLVIIHRSPFLIICYMYDKKFALEVLISRFRESLTVKFMGLLWMIAKVLTSHKSSLIFQNKQLASAFCYLG